ncbi:YtxH domain-containing protein [Cytobacillus gottheilii]|uniref:YtxH domain-containing protein n=1 Tax=Cytobacillus gottheilii TaxID=859144 RepID=UPI0009BB1A03|nr:YtxH domain-containing protein [Cytobacillus gottheilii]
MSKQDRSQFDNVTDVKEESMNTKDFMIGALIGGIIGAGAALLLAPKPGKELISDISDQASVLKEKTSKLRDTAMEKGTEIAGAAKEKTNAVSSTVSKQSSEIVNKVKGLTSKNNQGTQSEEPTAESVMDGNEELFPEGNSPVNDTEIQLKLDETKQAFDETELKYNR